MYTWGMWLLSNGSSDITSSLECDQRNVCNGCQLLKTQFDIISLTKLVFVVYMLAYVLCL